MAGAEAGDRGMVGDLVGSKDAEGDVLPTAPLDASARRSPTA
jgi:hypothetical protein